MTATAQSTNRPSHLLTRGDASAGTLAGQHAWLLRGVVRRTGPVLALLEARAWPHAELGTLTAFLRNAVLRQVAEEEGQLYPSGAGAPPFAELSAEHVRLHEITAELESVRSRPCSPHDLRLMVDGLLTTLRRHLLDEQAVFAALARGASDLTGGPR